MHLPGPFLRICGFALLAAAGTGVAGAAVLTGYLQNASGPQTATAWDIAVTNSGLSPAVNADIASFSLIQTEGAACTPVVLTSIPVSLGTIGASATVIAPMIIDFTSCSLTNTRFNLSASFSADGGLTGTLLLEGLWADPSRNSYPVYPASSIPEPASLGLACAAAALLFLRRRHCRNQPR